MSVGIDNMYSVIAIYIYNIIYDADNVYGRPSTKN